MVYLIKGISCYIFITKPQDSMILTNEMVNAALKYRAAKLWDKLDDSMIFAVRLPDGDTGYCCIMGNGGEHYALGFYRGDRGFATYLKTLSMADTYDQKMMLEIMCTYHCINCDFVNASDKELSKETVSKIRQIAADNSMKIQRSKGLPSFIKMDGPTTFFGLPEGNDAIDITTALSAAVAVAEKVKKADDKELSSLGFDPKREYCNDKGGKKIPLLTPGVDGSYEWGLTQSPSLQKDVFPEVTFNNIFISAKVKGIRHDGVMECRVIHYPYPIGNKSQIWYPSMIMLIDQATEQAIPVALSRETTDENESNALLLDSLGETLMGIEICPEEIMVEDDRTENLIADFCRKTEIKLTRKKSLPLLNESWDFIFSMTQRIG